MNLVSIIGLHHGGIEANGKASVAFWKVFFSVLSDNDIDVHVFPDLESFYRNDVRSDKAVYILVYNEDEDAGEIERLHAVEQEIRRRCADPLIVNSPAAGAIISHKVAAHQHLSRAGVSMPRRFTDVLATTRTFVNATVGSGGTGSIVECGHPLDQNRYNTEFIDTAVSVRGKAFRVSLRAMCVGRSCIAVYPRCRSAETAEFAVHGDHSPLDPMILNEIYSKIILKSQGSIVEMCDTIGASLGLGFYAHDLLPCASSGRVLLSEVGFKFDEFYLAQRFRPLEGRLMMSELFGGVESLRSAYAFIAEARRSGFLTGDGEG